MIAIKNMEMPSCCINCFAHVWERYRGDRCVLINDEINIHDTERADNCPLVEIDTCKDCKWLTTDEDGNYYCRQTGCFNSLDFYCADFEKRGNENG